ncbi:MAG: isochorismatase family protein [Pseudomonadota bacterium]|nr:isochorismatase family protein [Pseudomonadota bacterium]
MTKRLWEKFLTDRDKKVFKKSGFGAEAGFGKKPALLVIDVSYNFCGDQREPIVESIKRFHNSCGEDAWDALPHIRKIIDKCHEKNIPVIYTTGTVREDGWDSGGWAWKNDRTDEDVTTPNATGFNRDGNEIMDQIAPSPQDIVIYKHKPSAFYGTPLSGFLNDLGADSLLVTGTTTSGCVRASVIDAFSQNMRVTVVEEGCFDRSQASHAINLCDMHAKYADVLGIEEVINFVDGLDVDMNVPTGKPL